MVQFILLVARGGHELPAANSRGEELISRSARGSRSLQDDLNYTDVIPLKNSTNAGQKVPRFLLASKGENVQV